ncbi:MAG TPA: DUF3060 domain-containing protein [Kofleriaceae bacterium]|jgi:hypothetical protein|nr:DUF3060 domain-containing protein [Kofleriaceae bacterium]
MKRRLLLSILFLAAAVAPAFADEPTWKVTANDASYSYVCGGDDWVAISGNGNSLTITGQCGLVEVAGSGNKISIETVGTIKVNGNNNDVRYSGAPEGKTKPAIKNKGKANTIRKTKAA